MRYRCKAKLFSNCDSDSKQNLTAVGCEMVEILIPIKTLGTGARLHKNYFTPRVDSR